MKILEIKQLIKVIERSNIHEIEIEEEGLKIKISKNSAHLAATVPASISAEVVQNNQSISIPPTSLTESVPSSAVLPEVKVSENIEEIKSPMVGTFFRSPAPDADPYVEIGDIVKVGQTICIIEAMKLMNEIQSEVNGKISKILVENAQPVEYDKVLFQVEKS